MAWFRRVFGFPLKSPISALVLIFLRHHHELMSIASSGKAQIIANQRESHSVLEH